ncbi:MAG: hypothetical protein LBN92_06930, partial [Treponema sp.]|nr:hypothetical protein [Treponema sp.]
MEKGRLVFITIGEKLARDFGGLDVSIPLPVEVPAEKPEFDPRDLTEEMILSGMLRDLAERPEGKHSDYYRGIIGALKPNLLGELNEAAILKSRNGDHQSALEIFSLLDGLAPDHPLILLNKALVSEAISPDGEDAA